MVAAEQKKVLEERVALYTADISLLNGRIENLKAKDSLSMSIMGTYQNQIRVMEDQRKLYDTELSAVNKLLRKEKRKRFWTAMGGITVAVGGFWLGTKF